MTNLNKEKVCMRDYIIAQCSLCEYEFKISWDIIIAKYKEGLNAGASLGEEPCPQCRAIKRLSVFEDIVGRRRKIPIYTAIDNLY